MAIDIIVTTEAPGKGPLVLPSGRELYSTLGPEGALPPATVYVSELLEQIFTQVRASVNFECTVEASLTGSLTLTGKGDAKLLLFNVGAETQAQTTMSVKVITKLAPS